mmetsp:Transcript_12717/g.11284  ORF Transcript_12717/g.11284 Transcript_12717/m.11284 type:complete len:104 (+) Transcript_12717:389-700(+)
MLNLIQLYMLLLLTGAYFPKDVRDYISNMEFAMISLDFIPFEKIPAISFPMKSLNFDQASVPLKDIGIDSGSSFTSNISFLLMVFLIFFVHFCVFLLKQAYKV